MIFKRVVVMLLFLRFFVLLCVSIAFITASYGQDYNAIRQESEKACDLNNGSGCFNLGLLYDDGKSVTQDYTQANTFYTKACDMGNARGCFNLGISYDNGKGVRQNMQTAKELFGKACDLGEQKGCDGYKILNQ